MTRRGPVRNGRGHPIFAAVYDLMMVPQNWLFLGPHRRWVTGEAVGRVLEVGVGTGLNLPLYRTARTVVGLDPDPYMLRRAKARAEQAPVPVELHLLGGEALPFPDASFDTVISTLTFCTIPDPEAAAGEIRRVLRPGGSLRFLEHVRSPKPRAARLQDRVTPVWRRVFAGCHPNRDTLALFSRAGLQVVELRLFKRGIVVRGTAVSDVKEAAGL